MLVVLYIMFMFGIAVVGYAASKPSAYRVICRESIRAPAEKIFPMINNLSAWSDWSAREKRDSAREKSFSGPNEGKGAIYEWSSEESGDGQLEITESEFPKHLAVELETTAPFQTHSLHDFKLDYLDGLTTLTYGIFGRRGLRDQIRTLFNDLDEEVAAEIEDSLANIKALAERKEKKK